MNQAQHWVPGTPRESSPQRAERDSLCPTPGSQSTASSSQGLRYSSVPPKTPTPGLGSCFGLENIILLFNVSLFVLVFKA